GLPFRIRTGLRGQGSIGTAILGDRHRETARQEAHRNRHQDRSHSWHGPSSSMKCARARRALALCGARPTCRVSDGGTYHSSQSATSAAKGMIGIPKLLAYRGDPFLRKAAAPTFGASEPDKWAVRNRRRLQVWKVPANLPLPVSLSLTDFRQHV